MSTLAFEPLTVPLYRDEDGVIRVGDTRIVLEAILCAHAAGDNAQAIADNFPPLASADIYLILAYYDRHKEALDDYLRERREEADRLRKEIETAQGDDAEFWAETRTRWEERKKHAESGH